MAGKRKNFLLAFGEKLTSPIKLPGKRQDKNHPYSLEKAISRLQSRISEAAENIQALPLNACPNNEAVASITLHPSYLAKSYYPGYLLETLGLRAVGSKSVEVRPEISTKKNSDNQVTSELYVAGTREAFANFSKNLGAIENQGALEEIRRIEDIKIFAEEKKIKAVPKGLPNAKLEVVLHASALPSDSYILDSFTAYSKSLKVKPELNRRRHVGGLCFVPVTAPSSAIKDLAKFSFLRAVRSMPKLRPLKPGVIRAGVEEPSFQISTESAVDPSIQAAIFDGGLKTGSNLGSWATGYKIDDIKEAVPEYLLHGHAVTSAFLFGSIDPGGKSQRPFSNVDHYRVLDANSGTSSDLFDVLERIMDVLEQKSYQFINISLGPDLPVEDDDVHVWTATLDEYLSTGKTLATIAVGNNGEADPDLKLNRIQPPSDCVNAIGVGASDTLGNGWKRAEYSCVGPGRSPGIVKPDGIAFGGTKKEPFYVVQQANNKKLYGIAGTSFASPFVLRAAVGVRALLGEKLNPLALKCLLIHHTSPGSHYRHEVGWGHFNVDPEYLISCEDNEATIIYQGELVQGKYLRAPIPFPLEALSGKVSIKATFCFAAVTDPEHPIHYTRSGLEIIFRPHESKIAGKNNLSISNSFFSQGKLYATEQELRADAHKWETCVHREKTFNADTLKDPTFDIHFQAREQGKKPLESTRLAYALLITVKAPKTPDFYSRIVKRYKILQPLRPVNRLIVNS